MQIHDSPVQTFFLQIPMKDNVILLSAFRSPFEAASGMRMRNVERSACEIPAFRLHPSEELLTYTSAVVKRFPGLMPCPGSARQASCSS